MQDTSSCWTVGNSLLLRDENDVGKHAQHRFELNMQQLLENKEIQVYGDSLSRFFFNALKSTINGTEPSFKWGTEAHKTMRVVVGLNTTLFWKWSPPTAGAINGSLGWMNETNRLHLADHTLIMMGLHEVVFQYEKSKEDMKVIATILNTDYRPMIKELTFQTAAPISFPALNARHDGAGDKYLHDFPHSNRKDILEFNLGLARELQANNISNVLDGFWRFPVNDSDGKHSIIHAVHSTYRYLWRLYWFYI